jgi:hypothetical protein
LKCKIIKEHGGEEYIFERWETRKTSIGCDTKTVESAEYLDLGFSEILRKPFHGKQNRCGDVWW